MKLLHSLGRLRAWLQGYGELETAVQLVLRFRWLFGGCAALIVAVLGFLSSFSALALTLLAVAVFIGVALALQVYIASIEWLARRREARERDAQIKHRGLTDHRADLYQAEKEIASLLPSATILITQYGPKQQSYAQRYMQSHLLPPDEAKEHAAKVGREMSLDAEELEPVAAKAEGISRTIVNALHGYVNWHIKANSSMEKFDELEKQLAMLYIERIQPLCKGMAALEESSDVVLSLQPQEDIIGAVHHTRDIWQRIGRAFGDIRHAGEEAIARLRGYRWRLQVRRLSAVLVPIVLFVLAVGVALSVWRN